MVTQCSNHGWSDFLGKDDIPLLHIQIFFAVPRYFYQIIPYGDQIDNPLFCPVSRGSPQKLDIVIKLAEDRIFSGQLYLFNFTNNTCMELRRSEEHTSELQSRG